MFFDREDLNKKIENKIMKNIKYVRKINLDTLDEYYEKTISFEVYIGKRFDEDDFDYIFKYLKANDVYVQGYPFALLTDYDNYRYLVNRSGIGTVEFEKAATNNENIEMIKEYRNEKNKEQKKELYQKIVSKNLRLLTIIVNSISFKTGISRKELLGAGYEGLDYAIKNYDINKSSFSNYMHIVVTGFILNSLVEYYDFEKRNLYNEISKYKIYLEEIHGKRFLSYHEIADEILEEYLKDNNYEQQYETIRKFTFNVPDYFSDHEDKNELKDNIDVIESQIEIIFNDQLRQTISDELSEFPEEYKNMMYDIYGFSTGEPLSFRKVAKKYNVCHQEIARRHTKVMKKLASSEKLRQYNEYINS